MGEVSSNDPQATQWIRCVPFDYLHVEFDFEISQIAKTILKS